MKEISLRKILRDSALVLLVLGIPAGVLSDSVSNALFSRDPDWQYIAFVALLALVVILAYVVWRLRSIIRASSLEFRPAVPIEKLDPSERKSVGYLIPETSEEIVFFGIVAKRTVTEDAFKRSLQRISYRGTRVRFLLLDPACAAFEERAREEGESADVWRVDMRTTLEHLAAYKRSMSLNIEVKYYSAYPIWRAIIVDRSKVHVSIFLPGMRGTEAAQYVMARLDNDLAYGIIKSYLVAWDSGREVEL